MSKTPKYDAKVKAILDGLQPSERVCDLTGEKWEMTDEEIGWYKTFNVPPSKYSPLTRWRLMTSYFDGWQWWYNKHPKTGKPILSWVHPASGYKVIPDKEWYDSDFTHLTLDYDPERPFFEQCDELNKQIPFPASRDFEKSYNSITAVSLGDQDSYFVLACRSKRSIYCSCAKDVEDSAEIFWSNKVQNSYHVVISNRIFQSKFILHCFDCMNSSFLFDCRDCEYCFGATNKRHKKYLWFNEQLSKEEYEKRISEVDLSSRSELKKYQERFNELIDQDTIWPENFNESTDNCTGEYIEGCVNLKNCFSANANSRDMFWVTHSHGKCNNLAFCAGAMGCSYCYYTISFECSRDMFSYEGDKCNKCEYCFNCTDCEYCFACSGLKRKKYCIFNKQYSKDEFWEKLDGIKCNLLDRGEYGEYFPAKYSPTYFPDAGALVFDAEEMGSIFGAIDYDPESLGAIGEDLADTSKMRNVSEVPDCIDDMDQDEWVGVPVFDSKVNRRFSYLRPEIEFYKKNRIAPPDVHFIPRVKQLYFEGNLGVFDYQDCDKCKKEIMVARNKTYTDRTIYCKACYLGYLEQHG